MGKQKFLYSQEGCTFSLATPHSLWPVLHKISWLPEGSIREVILILKLCKVWKIQKKYLGIEIERVNFPLFSTSSSQDLYDIVESEWGVRAERLLTKSKSESDLRKVGVSSNILQSYVLDSLWLNLETAMKAEETALVF